MRLHTYMTGAPAVVILALAGCGGGTAAQVSQTATQPPTTTAASSPAKALPPPNEADRKSLEHALVITTAECVRVGAGQFSTGGDKAGVARARASISKQVAAVIALLHRIDPEASVASGTGTQVSGHVYVAKILEQLNYRPPVAGVPACAAEAAQRLEQATGANAG